MSERKEIWLPVSETRVTVSVDGQIRVWDEMEMTLRPVRKDTGFAQGNEAGEKK